MSTTDDIVHSAQKKIRKKPVVIAEHPSPETDDHVQTSASRSKSDAAAIKLEGNKDHLETKKLIEMLRREHGDSWLQNHGKNIKMLSPQFDTSAENRRNDDANEMATSFLFDASDKIVRSSTPLPLEHQLEGTTAQVQVATFTLLIFTITKIKKLGEILQI